MTSVPISTPVRRASFEDFCKAYRKVIGRPELSQTVVEERQRLPIGMPVRVDTSTLEEMPEVLSEALCAMSNVLCRVAEAAARQEAMELSLAPDFANEGEKELYHYVRVQAIQELLTEGRTTGFSGSTGYGLVSPFDLRPIRGLDPENRAKLTELARPGTKLRTALWNAAVRFGAAEMRTGSPWLHILCDRVDESATIGMDDTHVFWERTDTCRRGVTFWHGFDPLPPGKGGVLWSKQTPGN